MDHGCNIKALAVPGSNREGQALVDSVEKLENLMRLNFSQNLFFSKVRFKSCV
jgi:hypothetical protein